MDTCGSCSLYLEDKETYCKGAVLTGLVTAGTYQQYLVSPARYRSPIPDGVPDEIAGPLCCFPGSGDGVGIQDVQLAKVMGMRPIVVDTGESKQKLSLEMGAEAFVDFKEVADPTKAVIEIADGVEAHGVFVAASAAYNNAVSFIGDRIGGIVMCIDIPVAGSMTIGADPCQYIFKNLIIKGTLVGIWSDAAMALDFARRGTLRQISEVCPVNHMPEAVEKLQKGEVADGL
ncbi:Polyketide synthase enoylreductase [Penicillium fimorum]|uniref:Polyketide synthase enoylreductase n=1 Tax=Penicillium fimorum TaxID=1882269 RepID=A0A9W9Y0T3_9EURO|nr:Polyketide synthase enoylreductase [Penicillium fimorum]